MWPPSSVKTYQNKPEKNRMEWGVEDACLTALWSSTSQCCLIWWYRTFNPKSVHSLFWLFQWMKKRIRRDTSSQWWRRLRFSKTLCTHLPQFMSHCVFTPELVRIKTHTDMIQSDFTSWVCPSRIKAPEIHVETRGTKGCRTPFRISLFLSLPSVSDPVTVVCPSTATLQTGADHYWFTCC